MPSKAAAAGQKLPLKSNQNNDQILMANTKVKLGLIALVIVGATTTLVEQQQLQARLRTENESFRRQITRLEAEQENLTHLAAQATQAISLPTDVSNELLRLRSEVERLRQQTDELGRIRRENQKLLAGAATDSETTNQVSAEDRFILRQTHAVDAMTTLLQAVKDYATKHDGHYPESFDQMTAAGDLKTTNFSGNLGLDDFELAKDGWMTPHGEKVILNLRVPIPKPGEQSAMILGAISDDGVPSTIIDAVSPE